MQRKIKNVVKNYTYAEVKVREATSNDPWGPSGTLMYEISELTHDVLAFTEMMPMIWKRLNDHGKNWRHVYKSLVLLDFLVKNGSERVLKQCRDNIILIKTLRDFQHNETGLDCGLNVREAAKTLCSLLADEEKLRKERQKASSGARDQIREYPVTVVPDIESPMFGSERNNYRSLASTTKHNSTNRSPALVHRSKTLAVDAGSSSLPQDPTEEQLQLQVALAMSRESQEEEEKRRRAEELKLQMAIEESKKTAKMEQRTNLQFQQNASVSNRSQPKKKISGSSSTSSISPGHQINQTNQLYQMNQKSQHKYTNNMQSLLNEPWSPQTAIPENHMYQNSNAAEGFIPVQSKLNHPIFNNGASGFNSGDTRLMANDPWKSDFDSKTLVDAGGIGASYFPTAEPVYSSVNKKAPWEEVSEKFSKMEVKNYLNVAGASKSLERDEFLELSDRLVQNNGGINSMDKNRSIENWLDSTASAKNGVDDLLNLSNSPSFSSSPSNHQKSKKITPEQFLGDNAKLIDFNELVSKPKNIDNSNPFAMCISSKPAVVNPFVAKQQEEVKSKKVPLNQLQQLQQAGNLFNTMNPSSNNQINLFDQNNSSNHNNLYDPINSSSNQSSFPNPMNASLDSNNVNLFGAVNYNSSYLLQQPMVAQMQGYNPFL